MYFSIDDSLLYNAFHHDFGPLHIGHLYRFAVQLHDVLGDPENEGRGVVFWSKADSRSASLSIEMILVLIMLTKLAFQVVQTRHVSSPVTWFSSSHGRHISLLRPSLKPILP